MFQAEINDANTASVVSGALGIPIFTLAAGIKRLAGENVTVNQSQLTKQQPNIRRFVQTIGNYPFDIGSTMCCDSAVSAELVVEAGAPANKIEITTSMEIAGARLLSELAPQVADGWLSSKSALRQILAEMSLTVSSTYLRNPGLLISLEQWRACVRGETFQP